MQSNLSDPSSRTVAIWVKTGVAMLLIQVVLGGITRLTGSGLSITEWNVVTGTLPPLNHMQWQEAFDKYRQTTQYRFLNSGFNLPDFKFIFFWEWFHRFWARMVGVVFLVGFAYLLLKRKMNSRMIGPLVILFLLGALQGAIGWIMVASGLTDDAIYVAPARLALHFVFALGLIGYACWFALELSVPPREIARNTSLHRWTVAILVVLFFQLLYGALMAGHKAAAVAPTWPTINGDWVPSGIFRERSLVANLAGNKVAVQFIHRGLAYLLLILVSVWSVQAFRLTSIPPLLRRCRQLPMLLIGTQILLGILTLLSSPGIVPNHWVAFDWLAQGHQIIGLLFLVIMVGMLYLVRAVRHSVTV